MTQRKPYEVPRLIRVTLNPTQAVLTQCSVGASTVFKSISAGECSSPATHNCRRDQVGHGDFAAHS